MIGLGSTMIGLWLEPGPWTGPLMIGFGVTMIGLWLEPGP